MSSGETTSAGRAKKDLGRWSGSAGRAWWLWECLVAIGVAWGMGGGYWHSFLTQSAATALPNDAAIRQSLQARTKVSNVFKSYTSIKVSKYMFGIKSDGLVEIRNRSLLVT